MTFNIGTHYNPSATHITNAQEREYAGLETAVSSITAASTNASSTILAATSDTQIRIWGWSNATSGSVDNGHILTYGTAGTNPVFSVGGNETTMLPFPIILLEGEGLTVKKTSIGSGAITVYYTRRRM